MDSPSNLRSNSSRSVIVIGAGIGGITAAQNLTSSGYQVIVLESSDRIGGRIHTDRETFGVPVDMGASWIHGCDPVHNPIARLAERLELVMHETSGDGSPLYDHEVQGRGFELFCNGEKIDPETVREFEGWYLAALEGERVGHRDWYSVQMTMERIVSKHGIAGTVYEKLLHFYICRVEGWFAAGWDVIPSKNWIFEVFYPGGHKIFTNGYSQIVDEIAEGIQVRFNHRVTKVVHPKAGEPRRVRVTCENGSSFEADAAVVAVPLGVLQSDIIEFTPSLPAWKREAIYGLTVGHQNKIALMFDNLFWAEDAEFVGSATCTPSKCSYFLSLYRASRRPILVYMPVGALAQSLERMSDEDATEFAMERLREMFPNAPNPVKSAVSKWSSDTNFLGCYSYDPTPDGSQRHELMSLPVSDSLLFAGEHCSPDFSSTVHGAYETGVAAAETLTERFQREAEAEGGEEFSKEVVIQESLLAWVERRKDLVLVSCNLARQVLSALTLSN